MRRALLLETVAFVLLLAIGVALVWQVSVNRTLTREGQEAHDALCVFKTDLKRRIDSAQMFLEAHPGGVNGTSAADLQRSQNARRDAYNSLTTLSCPGRET